MEDSDDDDETAKKPRQPASKVDEDKELVCSADSQEAVITPKVEEDTDPGLADWFKVEEKIAMFPPTHEADDDSATEDDSDHVDLAPDAADEVDLDDWFEVKPMGEASTSTKFVSWPSSFLFYSD